MTTITKLRPFDIPRYFGGEHDIAAERRFHRAALALRKLAETDPILDLIACELVDAWAECMDDACRYGQAIGPDVERGVDEWTDEEYEARIGKGRPA